MHLLDRLRGRGGGGPDDRHRDSCGCHSRFESRTAAGPSTGTVALVVDADGCAGGDLAADPACRATVVAALADRDADAVRVTAGGLDRHYDGRAAALLLAAGRFADAVAFHDPDLGVRALWDPLGVAREATGRAGPVAALAAETGLALCSEGVDGYGEALRASVAPTGALGRTDPEPPADGMLRAARGLDTGGSVAVHDRPGSRPRYQLRPADCDLDDRALAVLAAARGLLADGTVEPGERAARRAVRRAVADPEADGNDTEPDLPVDRIADVLDRHTRGLGVLDELFADPRVTDASVSPPAADRPLRVVVDGEAMTTNVRLSAGDLATLASRVRAASDRGFSRSSPTADAALGRVRIAAVTDPASDGPGYAFRRRTDDPWTLPRLVAVGSLTPDAAGLLSVAVARGAAVLVAGPRGAGKTTLLGALCFELPPDGRSVVIEDTPELPLSALTADGRDVQGLRVGTDGDAALSPTDAVRTALRLGEGALVVGEVRGGEARALYEAMRVGAAADAVLGTIHGSGAASVRERVVSDLDVPASSWAATDLVVSLDPDRRLAAVEEVCGDGPGDLTTLAARDGGAARLRGPIDRGESAAVASLAGPRESYADVREAIAARADRLDELAAAGRFEPAAVSECRTSGSA